MIEFTRSVPFCPFMLDWLFVPAVLPEEPAVLPVSVPEVEPVVPAVPAGEPVIEPLELGDADELALWSLPFSSVPRTSTRWLTYLDQLSSLFAEAVSQSVLPIMFVPLVPVVPAVEPAVLLVVPDVLGYELDCDPLFEPIDTLVSMKRAPDALYACVPEVVPVVPVVEPDVPLLEAVDPLVVPAVLPVIKPDAVLPAPPSAPLAFCKQPVTVTSRPRLL